VVGQDVTDRNRMHEELLQSKKLASIGELVSGVAHELNNPLTIVMGFSQLLAMEPGASEQQRNKAQKILDAASRSKRIVENLGAFARKKKLEKQEVDINKILEDTLSLREHSFEVNNISLIRKYDKNLPLTYADGYQLQQVFLNLINNAFDAMYDANQGGALEVKTSRKNGRIIIEVADNGPGVPESLQEKIFDPFFTTKEVGKGTGLGMSLSYGIVKEHGGRIYLDTTHQNGASFVIQLPVTKMPATAN
jgi:two-component system NtrC family sensor kinase